LNAGIEVRLAPRCAFAWDVERTAIYRDTHAWNVALMNVYASFVALRGEL
jgi:hypothetical protein